MNLVETSNTILLLKPCPSDRAVWEADAAPNCHYEVVDTIPDMTPAVDMLNQNSIGSDTNLFGIFTDFILGLDYLDVFLGKFDSNSPKGIHIDEFRCAVQASDAYIFRELSIRRAISING